MMLINVAEPLFVKMIENQLMTIGLLFMFAIIGGIISYKFKQPFVLGLLIVGSVIGPFALGIVNSGDSIDLMIEFGAILFLFVIGLDFSVSELTKIGLKGFLVAILKVGIMFLLGFYVMQILGFDIITSVFSGVIVSFSSTVISMNILKQKKKMNRSEVPLLIAVLIIEDIIGVLALTFFHALENTANVSLFMTLQKVLINFGILILIYLLFSKFTERIVLWVSKNSNDEINVFIGLGICALFAILAYVLGLSPSAGAFLAGSIVSNFKESKMFETATKPHSMMFTSLFFIAIGTQIDFRALLSNFHMILLFILIMVVGMIFSIGVITRLIANYTIKNSVFSTIAMFPLGVFSLLIAKESANFNTSIDLVSITSFVLFFLAIFTSIMINYSDKIADSIKNLKKKSLVEAFSNYFSAFNDELKIEGRFTNNLSKKVKQFSIISIIVIVFLLLFINLIFKYVTNIYIYYLLLVVLVGIGFYLLYRSIFNIFIAMVKVLQSMDGRSSILKSKYIVKNYFFSFMLFVISVIIPLIMFLLKPSRLFGLIPIITLYFSYKFFKNATTKISNFNHETKYVATKYKTANNLFFKH